MSRKNLGFTSKYKNQYASIVGVFNYEGANKELKEVIEIGNKNRNTFYERI